MEALLSKRLWGQRVEKDLCAAAVYVKRSSLWSWVLETPPSTVCYFSLVPSSFVEISFEFCVCWFEIHHPLECVRLLTKRALLLMREMLEQRRGLLNKIKPLSWISSSPIIVVKRKKIDCHKKHKDWRSHCWDAIQYPVRQRTYSPTWWYAIPLFVPIKWSVHHLLLIR